MKNEYVPITLPVSCMEIAIHAIAEASEALSYGVLDGAPINENDRRDFFARDFDLIAGAVRCIRALSEIVSVGLANDDIRITESPKNG